jgi:phosphosulfolactate synthase
MNNFLNTPYRSEKPRNHGVTSLIDNGVPTGLFIDTVESSAEYIDIVKLGWCTSIVTKDLKKKIDCLLGNNIEYYFGGTLFEKALSQNKLDEFRLFLKKHNCRIMEVSDGTLDIPLDEKARHISNFSKEFHVLSEVGKKDIDEADNMPVTRWIEEILSDLSAGAIKVILESRESGMSGICDAHGNLRADLVAGISNSDFRISDAIWEAPNKSLQTSLISTFGPNVNLGNIHFEDVIGLETLRLGLRSDTFHLYNIDGSDFAESLPGRPSLTASSKRRSFPGFITERGSK